MTFTPTDDILGENGSPGRQVWAPLQRQPAPETRPLVDGEAVGVVRAAAVLAASRRQPERLLDGERDAQGTGDVPSLLETPGFATANPGFIDRVIHRDYVGSGADELATFEKTAAKLPNVRVLRPDPPQEPTELDPDPDSEADRS